MHILFLTDNFPPETNAPASRTHEHTKRWAAAGHRVTVVTTAPNFPAGRVFDGYRNRLWQRETIDGVEVIRLWTYITANEGFVRRTLDYVSFMVAAIVATPFLPRADVVVSTSPQFFTPCAAHVVSRLKRRPWVFELRDLWPDSIVAVGAMKDTPLIRALRRLEYFLYRRATRIVTVTNSFRKILSKNGIEREKIEVVPNGADLEAYVPGPRSQALAERLGVQGKFVAAYVGTIGMAHGLGTLLDAAEILLGRASVGRSFSAPERGMAGGVGAVGVVGAINPRPTSEDGVGHSFSAPAPSKPDDIAFVLVGAGAEEKALREEAVRRGLANVHFAGSVSKAEVREVWRLCDVALVLLRDSPLFRHVLPSKIFEAMATERPIILGVKGESEGVLREAQAGIAIPPENAGALVDAIVALADDPERRAALGRSGRAFVTQRFNRDVLAAKMLDVLREAASLAR